ncbi:MAG: hypothetical protein JWN76_697 [Chitinophagaceae bacterium]|nr:hypothetical protein [Chitinophagaceae bacterium]
MNTTKDAVTSSLEELIIINNDRYEGYKKAAEETKDPDLKELFTKYSMQSQQFGSELRQYAKYNDTSDRDETKLSGKFYRAWMDVKAALTGRDRKAVLSSCEFGEDVALKSYDNVMKDQTNLPPDMLSKVTSQHKEILQAHNRIKQMRDSA